MGWRNITLHLTEDEAEDLIKREVLPDIEGRLRDQLTRAADDRRRVEERKKNLYPHEFICYKCGGIAQRDRTGGQNDYCPLCGPI